MSTDIRDCQGEMPDTAEILMSNMKWIRENVPVFLYPEEKETIRKDRERWRQRIRRILFLLRR